MKLRDLRFHKEFDDFFTESFTLDFDDQKQAASEAATHISNTMILYCQAHDDPYYALNRMGGYEGGELRNLPNKITGNPPGVPNFILEGILEGYLTLKGGFLTPGNRSFPATMSAAKAIVYPLRSTNPKPWARTVDGGYARRNRDQREI